MATYFTFWRHKSIHAVWNSNLAWTSQCVLKQFNNRYIKYIIINDYSNARILPSLKHILIYYYYYWSTESPAICVIYSARHIEMILISSDKMSLIHYNATKYCIHNKHYTSYIYVRIYNVLTLCIQWNKIYLLVCPALLTGYVLKTWSWV
jgi:hypothetical protein